jgi:hypothetical protein
VDPVPKQVLALKGPNNLAQGNALGWPVPKQALALKGPNNLKWIRFLAKDWAMTGSVVLPFQGE